MPFDTTRVIPSGWSRHHAAAAAGGMNATVRVYDPAATTTGWDADDEATTVTGPPDVYLGPARVQQISQPSDVEQTGQSVTEHRYLVQLPMDAAPIQQGWALVVTAAPNDPQLVAWTTNRPAHITDVQFGSERFTRDLQVSINLD